uniref:Uncharacterized protein n=1 Tax=Nelumbo nucifera TaxID=4432 RepID=A0A822XT90_NELNU|nr:TPA_asm: hypothetical protein HUJ06_023498 [Nelumbo nucifera]
MERIISPELWEAGPKENLLGMLSLTSNCTVEALSVRLTWRSCKATEIYQLRCQSMKSFQV